MPRRIPRPEAKFNGYRRCTTRGERRIECITIEAHSREEHLRAQFEILADRLGPLAPLEVAPTSLFATLLETNAEERKLSNV